MWVDLCRGNENIFDDGNRTFTVEAAAVGATHTGSEVQNQAEQSWEDQSKMCKTMATADINLQLRKMVPVQFVFNCFAAERVGQEIISRVFPVVPGINLITSRFLNQFWRILQTCVSPKVFL